MFSTYLLGVAAIMAAYVFWRMDGLPLLGSLPCATRLILSLCTWVFIMISRYVGRANFGQWSMILETAGLSLLIILFLTAMLLAVVDIVTVFGRFLPAVAPTLRFIAFAVALALSDIALIQGMRAPVITKYEIALPNLPAKLDGMNLVAVSDLHVGTQLGPDWLMARAEQIMALKPDMILLLGDIVEGHSRRLNALLPALCTLRAPLGVYAVPGNHENHGFPEKALRLLSDAGFTVLVNKWDSPAPGLVVAGVEDLSTHQRDEATNDPVADALADRPAGATILLSHTPLRYEEAASLGTGLMLAGHTHGGQIWPFNYVVRLSFPMVEGKFEIGPMTFIVTRGAGVWGARMRLWNPGEILKITLRTD
jgi:hypothetical protein